MTVDQPLTAAVSLGREIWRAILAVGLGEALVVLCWLGYAPPIRRVSGGAVFAAVVVFVLSAYAVAGVMIATHGSAKGVSIESAGHAALSMLRASAEPADEGSMRD